MKNTTIKKYSLILLICFTCVFLVFSSFFIGKTNFAVLAFDEDDDIVSAFEAQNCYYDLTNSVIGDDVFDLSDYPHNDSADMQIIILSEFGYSSYADKQDDYGIYVYIYNPQDANINTSSSRNKIQMKFGDLSTNKYPLRFLNYSINAGYEGRFFKFKVDLTIAQTTTILKAMTKTENARKYSISGFEICVGSIVTEYPCISVYTYSGYALGYGSDFAQESTLSCSVDDFDKYIELDVKHTTYRPEGDYNNGEQSQLDSCYFAVPNKYFEDYGNLTKIMCEWYEYFTKPILVTEDSHAYRAVKNLNGGPTSNILGNEYFLYQVYWENCQRYAWFHRSQKISYSSNYDFGDTEYHFGFLWKDEMEYDETDKIDSFAATFFTNGKNCEDYEVSSEQLVETLENNANTLGGELVNDLYSEALFENYVQLDHNRGRNVRTIKSTDVAEVFTAVRTKEWWQHIFGGENVETIYDEREALQVLTDDDMTGTDASISKALFVNVNDVPDLKAAYAKAKLNDSQLVILRYSSTIYMCAPCVAVYTSKTDFNERDFAKSAYTKWNDKNFNGYCAQETVYLDFDIISLTFTLDGVETEVPVISSPTNHIASLTPPLKEPGFENSKRTLKMVIAIVALVIILIILGATGLLPFVLNIVTKIILLPFKLVAIVVDTVSNNSNKNKKE